MQANTEVKKKEYQSVAKGTALMGGVQVYNIIINVIRGKLVAMFLGSDGMGVLSLFTSSTNVVQQISSLGLNLAIVKVIAGAESTERRNLIIAVVRKLLLFTAILGALLTLILSPWLSLWSFGDKSYTLHIAFLGVMVFLMTLSNGESSILQGAHTVKRLAYSSLVGSTVGLLVGVPLYYFYGQDGIAPAMIALSLATYIFYKFHANKEFGKLRVKFSWKEQRLLVRAMILLGLVFMLASFLGNVADYGLYAFIRYQGTLNDVGLFQAANSITNQYVGLVFAAMSADYFPRLAAVSFDTEKMNKAVNQQEEIILLVVAPMVMLIILGAPLLIRILLTEEFLELDSVIRVLAVAVFFKAIYYPMGLISFAKGDKKTFFWLEGVWGNLFSLSFKMVFYYLGGLIGLGVSMVCVSIIYIGIYLILTNKLYHFSINKVVLKLFTFLGTLVALCYGASFISNLILSYGIMVIVCVISVLYSFRELDDRIGIKLILKSKLYRYIK